LSLRVRRVGNFYFRNLRVARGRRWWIASGYS